MSKSFRIQAREAYRLAKAKASGRIKVADGLRFQERIVSTGTRVIYCACCKAPLVDSDAGRQAHVERSPKCEGKIKE